MWLFGSRVFFFPTSNYLQQSQNRKVCSSMPLVSSRSVDKYINSGHLHSYHGLLKLSRPLTCMNGGETIIWLHSILAQNLRIHIRNKWKLDLFSTDDNYKYDLFTALLVASKNSEPEMEDLEPLEVRTNLWTKDARQKLNLPCFNR